jgi:hypothetical protein
MPNAEAELRPSTRCAIRFNWSGRSPLDNLDRCRSCAEYWDARAANSLRMAQDMLIAAARASMVLIAAQYRVLTERVRQAERPLAETDR